MYIAFAFEIRTDGIKLCTCIAACKSVNLLTFNPLSCQAFFLSPISKVNLTFRLSDETPKCACDLAKRAKRATKRVSFEQEQTYIVSNIAVTPVGLLWIYAYVYFGR